MTQKIRVWVCQECAKENADSAEHCTHAMEVWRNGYDCALRERPRPRLMSDDVRQAISGLSFSWKNFYHLAADALNRILDNKENQ